MRGGFKMFTTVFLFVIYAVIAIMITLGVSFLIVETLDNPKNHRVLQSLWNTGYMGHTIFILSYVCITGIGELFINFLS
jgi:hypothetical protein